MNNCLYCDKELSEFDKKHSDRIYHLEIKICHDCYVYLDLKPEMIYIRDNGFDRENAMKLLGLALSIYKLDGIFDAPRYNSLQEVIEKEMSSIDMDMRKKKKKH